MTIVETIRGVLGAAIEVVGAAALGVLDGVALGSRNSGLADEKFDRLMRAEAELAWFKNLSLGKDEAIAAITKHKSQVEADLRTASHYRDVCAKERDAAQKEREAFKDLLNASETERKRLLAVSTLRGNQMETVAKLEAELTEARQAMDSVRDQRDRLAAGVIEDHRRIGELEIDLAETQRSLQLNCATVDEYRERIESLERENTNLREVRAREIEMIKSRDTTIAELRAELDEADRLGDAAAVANHQAQALIDQQRIELSKDREVRARCLELEAELDRVRDLTPISLIRKDIEAEYEKVCRERDDARKMFAVAEQDAATLMSERNKASHEALKAQDALETARSEGNHLAERVMLLESQLGDASRLVQAVVACLQPRDDFLTAAKRATTKIVGDDDSFVTGDRR